ncbi:beta-lactamase family protein [Maribacter sp.]|nr:beta-lactamase family protein [Maribacter sp.]
MNITSKYTLIIFCVVLFVPIRIEAQTKESATIENQIDAIFSTYENKPGCALAVIKNGETLFQKGYGLANLEYENPVTAQTVFDANAVAKQITAACVFLLEEEGKLSLDDPIQKFFPEFPEYDEGSITVKNLIYQSSGLRSYLAILYAQHRYFGDKINNGKVLKLVGNQLNLNFQPGSKSEYSHTNYALLSSIIEKVSGKKMAAYAKEKLFDPLHMTSTFFIDNPNRVIKKRALAYEQEGDDFVRNHFFNSSVIGDGGLETNLEDLVRWNNNLNSAGIGENNLMTKMVTSGTLNSGAATNYAGGVFLQNHYDIEGLPTVRHSGEWAGFRSLYYKFLEQDISFIILSNNANTNVWALLDRLTPLFLEDEIATAQAAAPMNKASKLKAVRLSTNEKRKFDGSYYNMVNGNVRSIALRNDTLFYKRSPNAPGTHLFAVSRSALVFKIAPELKLSFNPQNFKTITLTFNEQNPETFQKYEKYDHSKEELKEYEKEYYNKDCEVVYQIAATDTGLSIFVADEELVSLTSMGRDMFREEHFGYIKFNRDDSGNIDGFSRQDNTFTNLKFHRIKTSS